MRAFRSTLLLVAVATGCIPPTANAAGEIAAPGVYPSGCRTERTAARDEEWRPASEFVAALHLPGSLSSLLAAVPPIGSPVVGRSFSWPASVQVAGFGPDGVHLRGAPVPADRLSTELRCLGLPGGAPIGVSVRLVAAAQAVKVEARIDSPPMVACDISYSGRKRLEAVATDAWMWGRTMVARGSSLPAAR